MGYEYFSRNGVVVTSAKRILGSTSRRLYCTDGAFERTILINEAFPSSATDLRITW